MTPATSLPLYSPSTPIRLDNFGKRIPKSVIVSHLLPFFDIRTLSCFLRALPSGLSGDDRVVRLQEQALSSKTLFLDELLEYFWYTGKTLDDLVKNPFSFTRTIRHLSLCSSEYNKNVTMHPLIRAQMQNLPEEWDKNFFNQILSCFPLLHSLDLSGRKLGAGALSCIPDRCPGLVRLVLQGMELDDRDLTPIGKMAHLEHLDLDDNQVHGKNLREIVTPRIFSLSLSYTNVNNACLLRMKLPFLRKLHLCDTELADSGLRAIANSSPFLHVLDIRNCGLKEGRVTTNGIVYVADRCPNLQSYLFAENSLLTDKLLQTVLPSCKSLTECNLQGASQVTDKGLECAVRCCPNLKSLPFSCTAVTDVGFELFKKLATARPKLLGIYPCIDVHGTGVTSKSLMDVPARFPHLQYLSFDEDLLNDDLVRAWVNVTFPISPAYSELSDSGIDDLITIAKRRPEYYQTLDLRRTHVTVHGIMKIPNQLPKLEHFLFDSALLIDEVMVEIAKHCTSLRSFRIYHSKLSEKGVQIFIRYAHEHPIVLGPASSLDLRGLPITKETLIMAAKLLPLKELIFNPALITDELVVELTRHCKTLKSFTMDFERISEVGEKAIADIPHFNPLIE